MLRAYNDWISSNRVVFPYPGSRLMQPIWVLTYFDIFESVSELQRLEGKRPSLVGVPSLDDVLGT